MIWSRPSVRLRLLASALLCFMATTVCRTATADDSLEITKAEWESEASELLIRGIHPEPGARVKLFDAETSEKIAAKRVNERGEWKKVIRGLDQAPCRVLATSDNMRAERDVENAPGSCNQDNNQGGSGDSITAHSMLTYDEGSLITVTCLDCHYDEAEHVFHSTHYQWKGDAPDMVNPTGIGIPQGKHAGAVNTYCGNILGNWNGCSGCHIGLGVVPEYVEDGEEVPFEQLANIDCLICHQEQYKRIKIDGIFVPDEINMTIGIDEAVQTVHKPTRATCLQCHAKAGGGDAVKRGDLALATANTTDRHYDVHMATTGANLVCQDCHTPENHRFPGKGSDIRPSDTPDIDLECASAGCHDAHPHGGEEDGYLDGHTQRVACQTCHIPVYAKDAADTAASEATEIHRSWQAGTHHDTPPYHPVTEKANDLTPVYRHWNRLSNNTLLFDQISPNQEGIYETSVPVGSVDDSESKLYPFKYKTSDYPLRTEGGNSQLIALNTSVFFTTPKDEDFPDAAANAAAVSGLENMKDFDPSFDPSDEYQWVITDTYQLLNHQVSDKDDALSCNQCHMSTARMDLQGEELGYAPKNNDTSSCASDCHSGEKASEWHFGDREEFEAGHKKHREKDVACSRCHNFER